jgi:ribonuclease Y
MPDPIVAIVAAAAALIIGVVIGYVARRLVAGNAVRHAETYADRLVAEARAKQKEIVLEGKDEALKLQRAAEEEAREKRADLQRQERLLLDRSESLDRKLEALERREAANDERQKVVDAERAQLAELQQRQLAELERVGGLSVAEARHALIQQIADEAQAEAAHRVREIERHAQEEGEERARRVLTTVMQRIAADHTSEATVSVVHLPSEEMKGRIIGREGRNIRALEQATGVDLIVDDTPEVIMISAYDPLRRELARRVLSRLLQDGRIHPTRIEEVVNKAQVELDQTIREEGDAVAYEANVVGLHPDLIKLLGRLKYRTSYGQNVLAHSLEVSVIAGALASELGADVNVCKTAGLLHDIGKAVDHEVEGPHALIGADIAKRLGRSAKIVHAIAAHHGEEEPLTVEAFIVATADAISGARPGARREMVETYTKRLEALEGVANSFDGVEKSFAIQAGREIRILVSPNRIDDLAATELAHDVVKKIEETLEYPGQIKVTVIRETRSVDYAR